MEMAGSMNAPTQDLKFMTASNVNVSNFVSVKLSGRVNYIWKAQMLCLIKSQALLHIVDARCPSPEDKGVHMIEQYDELVKGWIFGSVNERVLNDLVDLPTAKMVWMKLESLVNQLGGHTEGYSSQGPDVSALDVMAPVVYAMREDLKYIQALNVDVSNFVSEKLEGKSNYYTWKNEMLYLIECHELLHIIHTEPRFPWQKADSMTQKYDSLVRGWIFSTMKDKQRHRYRMYRSVQLMWRNLESEFTYQPETSNINTDDGSSNGTNVNISNFVSVKLSGQNNYSIWRAQMLCFIETHDLLHTFNHRITKMDIYDDLVKGWIFRTINDELLKRFNVTKYYGVRAALLWEKLESHINDSHLRPEPVTEDLKYTQALNVTVSNFISVKLSGRGNYNIWKVQMLCLIQSQKLLHVIDGNGYTLDKYEHLVKGWIFSTMNEQLFNHIVSTYDLTRSFNSVKDVWEILKETFDAPESKTYREDSQDPQGLTFGIEFIKDNTEFVSNLPKLDSTDKKRLYIAVANGWWRKAKSIFSINKNAATEAVTLDIETESSRTEYVKKELYEAVAEGRWRKAKSILQNGEIAATEPIAANGNTILHVAVEMGHNYFVEKLLEFIEDKQVEIENYKGRTALHIAAMVGNTNAAQLLVEKRNQLLQIKDHNNESALHLAAKNTNVNIYAYLSKSFNSEVVSVWSERSVILAAIFSKQYDFVEKFLKTISFDHHTGEDIFMAVTISFPTDLCFTESLIYPCFHNVRHKTAMRGSLLFNPDRRVDDIIRVVNICNNSCYNWWGKNSKILLVQPIKNIEKKKNVYKEAKKILRMVCKKMGPSHLRYSDSLFEVVRLDIYEVVDEILFTSPATINCKDEDGYNIISHPY